MSNDSKKYIVSHGAQASNFIPLSPSDRAEKIQIKTVPIPKAPAPVPQVQARPINKISRDEKITLAATCRGELTLPDAGLLKSYMIVCGDSHGDLDYYIKSVGGIECSEGVKAAPLHPIIFIENKYDAPREITVVWSILVLQN